MMKMKSRTPSAIWKAAHDELKHQMTRATFDTWLRDAHFVSEDGGNYIIGVSNVYARDWLEHRLKNVVTRTLRQMAGEDVSVSFIIHSTRSEEDDDLSAAGPLLANIKPRANNKTHKGQAAFTSADGLNNRYTFNTFVEGATNRLARAMALSAAEAPAQMFNPLVICGEVGMGKSHLLHAIGHVAEARGLSVLCVPAETFTNDLVEAIRSNTTHSLREKYRSVDLLLMDDVQFVAGKEITQEEFYHTFNTLYEAGKQIVVTCDVPPAEIANLDERIRSRLEGGMIAEIAVPDIDTRVEIVRAKARTHGKTLPVGVLEEVARRAGRNVRQLEGALNRVLAQAQVSGTQPTITMAEDALCDFVPEKTSATLDQILRAVATVFRIEVDDMQGRNRSKVVSLARQVAMFVAREETDESLPAIGERLGGRNHSTVLYSCTRVEEMLADDPILREQVTAIKVALHAMQMTQPPLE